MEGQHREQPPMEVKTKFEKLTIEYPFSLAYTGHGRGAEQLQETLISKLEEVVRNKPEFGFMALEKLPRGGYEIKYYKKIDLEEGLLSPEAITPRLDKLTAGYECVKVLASKASVTSLSEQVRVALGEISKNEPEFGFVAFEKVPNSGHIVKYYNSNQ